LNLETPLKMEEEEKSITGQTRKLPAMSSQASLTHPPPSSSTHLHNRGDPTLAPSFMPPSAPKSISPNSEPFPFHQSSGHVGEALEGNLKPSDSESNSASQYAKRDSLIEPNSDWSDEEVMPRSGLPVGSLATGLCYDERMRFHCEVRPTSDVHPEDPRRIWYIYKELCRAGLVDDPMSTRPLAPQTLQRIKVVKATQEQITMIHTEAHYAFVKSTQGTSRWFCGSDPITD
jgi:histone deacetylase 6